MTEYNTTERPSISPGKWWLCAVLSPFVLAVIGFFFALESNDADWLGLRFLIYPLIGMVGAIPISLICAIVSFLKREPQRKSALAFSSLFSVILLTFMCTKVIDNSGQIRKAYMARVASYKIQLQKDPGVALREKWYLVPAKDSAKRKAYVSTFQETPYTDEMLQELFKVSGGIYGIMRHSGWSEESLVEKYDYIMTLSPEERKWHWIQDILLNWDTPNELIHDAVNKGVYTSEELKRIFKRKNVSYPGP